jgi:hypothetical protein
MSDLIVIGICGRARSGKTTAANTLALYRGCHVVGLADGIREAFMGLSGPTAELHKELTEAHNFRRMLQTLGTESRNAVNAPGLWVHLVLAKIHYLSQIHPVPRLAFVIPDIRYRHEESMIRFQVARWRGRFGVLKLIRPAAGIPEADHSSERDVDNVPCHGEYRNDGTIEQLIDFSCNFFDLVSVSSLGVA